MDWSQVGGRLEQDVPQAPGGGGPDRDARWVSRYTRPTSSWRGRRPGSWRLSNPTAPTVGASGPPH